MFGCSQRSSLSSPHSSPGDRLSDSSETEGEFSPANSGIDPELLRRIKRKTELNKLDQEVGGCHLGGAGPTSSHSSLVQLTSPDLTWCCNLCQVVRLIGQHLCDVGLRTSADVLMKEAGCR